MKDRSDFDERHECHVRDVDTDIEYIQIVRYARTDCLFVPYIYMQLSNLSLTITSCL